MIAVILCGGKGTRLQGLAQDIPKPMFLIGDKPILEHLVINLKRYGIEDIILVTGHLSQNIETYFGDGSRLGIQIRYFIETVPLGTTGGIKSISHLLTSDFLVLYGDVMMDFNFKKFIAYHFDRKGIATIVVHPNNHPGDSDLVEIDSNGKVLHFYPKPHKVGTDLPNLVNAALYILSPRIIEFIKDTHPADFGKDIFPTAVKFAAIYAYRSNEYLKDAGTPERYEQVNLDYKSGKIARMNSDFLRNAVFLDRDGVLNEDLPWISKPEEMRLLPGCSDSLRRLNESEYLSVVLTNQPVVSRGGCTIQELDMIHRRLDTLLGKAGAWFDALYFCPHHPDKGFPGENPSFKVECECRKPKPGLVFQAQRELGIDLSKSYFIGDSFRDIECARRAGVTSIAVRTGKGTLDGECEPDFIFDDLLEAVNFILDRRDEEFLRNALALVRDHIFRPVVISIGGNSRSGKSTVSAILRQRFADEGVHASIISLDQWILPEAERSHAFSVYDRFDMVKLVRDVKQLLNGHQIEIASYNSMTRKRNSLKTLKIGASEVVILEGVVALSSPEIRELSHIRAFKDVSFDLLKKRFLKYCDWRGIPIEEAIRLFEIRLTDEYNLIDQEKIYGDWVL